MCSTHSFARRVSRSSQALLFASIRDGVVTLVLVAVWILAVRFRSGVDVCDSVTVMLRASVEGVGGGRRRWASAVSVGGDGSATLGADRGGCAVLISI